MRENERKEILYMVKVYSFNLPSGGSSSSSIREEDYILVRSVAIGSWDIDHINGALVDRGDFCVDNDHPLSIDRSCILGMLTRHTMRFMPLCIATVEYNPSGDFIL